MRVIIVLLVILFSFSFTLEAFENTEVEKHLKDIDLKSNQYGFKKLDGSNSNNWAIKHQGKTIANLKCSGKNTFHPAGRIIYQLGKLLDLNYYPVAIPYKVERKILFHYLKDGKILEGVKFIKDECILKEWVNVYAPYYWIIDKKSGKNSFLSSSKSKLRLVEALNCKSDSMNMDHYFYSFSSRGFLNKRNAEDRIYYLGKTSLYEAARDFSNILVMDAIIGNEDRFPGGNLHFRSRSNSYSTKSKKIFLKEPGLFSLDNESSFRGDDHKALLILEEYVSKFDHSLITKLKDLKTRLKSVDTNTELPSDLKFLNYKTWITNKPVLNVIVQNIQSVLDVVKKAEKKCSADTIYF